MDSQRPARLDVVLPLLGDESAAHDAGVAGPSDEADADYRRLDVVADGRRNDDGHDQVGDGEEYVGYAHHYLIEPAADEAAEHPNERAADAGDENDDEADAQAYAPPVEDA